MYKLFLDTHSDVVTMALLKDKDLIVKNAKSNRSHSEICVLLLKELFDDAGITYKDIEEILVVNGPGSFTGIRIGLTIAKVMSCFGDIKIKTISSLVCYCVSDNSSTLKTSVIEENNGYYYCKMDKDNNVIMESYSEDVDSLSNIDNIVSCDLDILKIFDYSKNLSYVNPHGVKANYIKKIQVEK